MKVKYITLYAGPDGVIRPGTMVDVAESIADALVSFGCAEYAEPKKTPLTPLNTAKIGGAPKKKAGKA